MIDYFFKLIAASRGFACYLRGIFCIYYLEKLKLWNDYNNYTFCLLHLLALLYNHLYQSVLNNSAVYRFYFRLSVWVYLYLYLQCTAFPLRIFFKESLTHGPLNLCVNEKTVRVNDFPYFQFWSHTAYPSNTNKNHATWHISTHTAYRCHLYGFTAKTPHFTAMATMKHVIVGLAWAWYPSNTNKNHNAALSD